MKSTIELDNKTPFIRITNNILYRQKGEGFCDSKQTDNSDNVVAVYLQHIVLTVHVTFKYNQILY